MALFGRGRPTGILILWLALSPLAFAIENVVDATPASTPTASTEETGSDIPTLATVTVVGQVEPALTVSESLSRAQIDRLPQRNGSINELIGILPGVQLGDEHRTSDNAGEILPPNLSISGGRFYENNFMIDGLGNNSLLDPAFDNSSDLHRVPGHPQEVFLHPSLLDQVSVYRSNIPARFGGFTGGVVDAQTRDPADTPGGQMYLRHTRSEWSELHTATERKAEYDNPTTGKVQPEFRKYEGSFSLDVPITKNSGALVAVSRIYSKIPLQLVDDTETQHRTLDNYFLKYVAQLSPRHRVTLSGNHTPYAADLFLPETVGSSYTINNAAHGFAAKLQSSFEVLALELNLGYRKSSNNREAPSNYFPWQVTASKPWGDITDADLSKNRISKEGGYGDLEQSQKTWTANLSVSPEPVKTSVLTHQISFGVSYEHVEGRYERDEPVNFFSGVCGPNSTPAACTYALASQANCLPGDIDCIAGEQFIYQKNVYPADSTDAVIRFYDAYVEDTINWGRLTIRPGLRFSSDDLQYNDNWAIRLAAGLDLLGDGGTMLIGGSNRYYGKTLLTHALAEKRTPFEVWRRDSKSLDSDNNFKPWTSVPRSVITATRLAELDTPYTDEWTAGLSQKLAGGRLNLDYVERSGKDELYARVLDRDPTGHIYTEWTNDGRSQHREATLSWERSWQNHYLLISAAWQETETSNETYNDLITAVIDWDKNGMIDPVWYHGRLVERDELPRSDFNREWTAAITYIGRLPGNFFFTNVARYRSPYAALENTGEDYVVLGPDNSTVVEKYDIYDDVKQSSSLIFDWRLDWERQLWRDQMLVLTLEVNNVFDKKVRAGERIDIYELGRQFWLGMTYKF